MNYPITAYTLCSAAGVGLDETRRAIASGTSGLRPNDFAPSTLATWIGRCGAADRVSWGDDEAIWESRNNALAVVALEQDGVAAQLRALRERVGPRRIGVAVGTSTSSVGRTEEGYRELEDERMPASFRQRRVHNPHSLGEFITARYDLRGPSITISTACSSSAKVFAVAARWLALDLVDAVLLGGVDSLCLSVLHGFNSLELTSERPCRPFDAQRDGISIGEAAGFAILVAPDAALADAPYLAGYGESSDAHHMSHPHPEGLGARLAMQAALERATLSPGDVDYINLHGTASLANDAIEMQALASVFAAPVPASSTKGWTGHTLGAAGILEALMAVDVLDTGLAPGTLNLETPDPALAFPVQADNVEGSFRHVLSNSFGFGGNNCSLVFGRRA